MSVYDKSLEQIQSSYQFTDLEMAKMDYTLKVFAYELSKLVFFFVFFAVIGKFSEFAVCLVALLPFRWISGGIHLKHYWSCFIFSFCFFAVILFMGEMFYTSPICTNQFVCFKQFTSLFYRTCSLCQKKGNDKKTVYK